MRGYRVYIEPWWGWLIIVAFIMAIGFSLVAWYYRREYHDSIRPVFHQSVWVSPGRFLFYNK